MHVVSNVKIYKSLLHNNILYRNSVSDTHTHYNTRLRGFLFTAIFVLAIVGWSLLKVPRLLLSAGWDTVQIPSMDGWMEN